MNKEILDLKTSEEKKILFSKILKKVDVLSIKTKNYFDKSILISSEKIKNAYSNNEDLISILEQNNELIDLIQNESYSIRSKHQTNFTKEIQLDVSQNKDEISIIQNTLDYKDEFINSNDKMSVLSKRQSYLSRRNARRKQEMNDAIENLELRIDNNNLLDIKPMKEDVSLIKNFIDKKEISKSKILYLFSFVIFMISLILLIIFIGGLLWV